MIQRLIASRPAAVAAYLAAWAVATAYLAVRGADWSFPVLSLVLFGGGFTALAWFLTRKVRPPPTETRRPGAELAALGVFLVVYAVGFLGLGLTWLRAAVPAGPGQEFAILAAKLVAHVVVPAVILAAMGASLRPLFTARTGGRDFWLPLLVLSGLLIGLFLVVTPSLSELASLSPPAALLAWAIPASFLWIALEAGLTEEFLFRAVLQTRLAAVMKSDMGAVVTGALIFALAHAPGLYLRGAGSEGASSDPLQVVAYTIAALSPLAILFGVLWARTRNLLLVVLLHAMVDVVPGLPDFLRTWG